MQLRHYRILAENWEYQSKLSRITQQLKQGWNGTTGAENTLLIQLQQNHTHHGKMPRREVSVTSGEW